MYIKNDEISKYFNNKNWELAHKYNNNNSLKKIEIFRDDQGFHLLGQTKTDARSEVHLDFSGTIKSFTCDCPYCENNINACGHIGALLLRFNNLQSYQLPYSYGINTGSSLQVSSESYHQELIQHQLEALGKDLINTYQTDIYQSLKPLNKNIRLVPQVSNYMKRPVVRYKIGTDRLYLIQNLPSFIEMVNHQTYKEYGKNLITNHLLSDFTPESQKIYQFIRNNINNRNPKEILITNDKIDDFFESHLTNLDINILFTTIDYHNFNFLITKKETNIIFAAENDYYHDLLLSPNYIYSFENNILNRYSKEYSAAVLPLLKQTKYSDIAIPNEDLGNFHKYVIDRIAPYVNILGDDINDSALVDLNLQVFLDINEHGELTLNYEYVDDLEQVLADVSDYLLPLKVESALNIINQNFEYDDITDMYYIFKEADIYKFISDEISNLNKYCTVYVSEDIKNINKPKRANISLGIRLQNNLLEIDLQSINISKKEILDVLKSYRTNKQYHRLQNGDFIDLKDYNIIELNNIINDLNIQDQDLINDTIKLDPSKSLYFNQLSLNYPDIKVERDSQFNKLITNITSFDNKTIKVPQKYQTILRPYQVEGFNWLTTMSKYGFGGILADDMGLGKTLQIIVLLESIKSKDKVSLVVCPATLIYNWQDEVAKFTDTLKVTCIVGNKNQRLKLIKDLNNFDLVITSYDYIRRDYNDYQDYSFEYLILDEAQNIKNQKTKNAHSVKEIKGKHRLALTGTPIENSLAELWSIFDFLMPNYLFTYNHFADTFEKPIVKDKDETMVKRLKQLVSPFILRRTKKEVLDNLPDKIERNYKISFSEEENKIYLANLAQISSELQNVLNLETIDKFKILAMMTRLRQLCCDQRILYPDTKNISSKMQACLDLIRTAKQEGNKVLLFSSFTSTLDLIEEQLRKEDITYYVLTGSTSKIKRHQLVNAFQDDDTDVFLISLKSGGTGLNLTAASIVIHFDPWWNMSAQAQATDRAYRIGQTKNVLVYKLIMKNSIEEKIQELQEKKQNLSDTFVEGNQGTVVSMSKEDILNLFQIN